MTAHGLLPPSLVVAISSALLAVPLVVVGGAAPIAAAAAATGPIIYSANPGDDDRLTVTLDGTDLLYANMGAAKLPASLAGRCTPQAAAVGVAARCRAAGRVSLVFDMKDGDDVVDARRLPSRFTFRADLGAVGPAGYNLMFSGEGESVLIGGSGTDILEGGDGDDRIIGGGGSDLLDGGPGNDLIDASKSGPDDFGSLFGEDGSDRMIGGEGIDFLYADGDTDLDPSNDAGRDVLDGRGGGDYIVGGGLTDVLSGGAGDDEIVGDDATDPDTGEVQLYTGPAGSDAVSGGSGDDVITGGGGKDLLSGDGGADTIDAKDGEADLVGCGAGADAAQLDTKPADRTDGGCETVNAPPSTARKASPPDRPAVPQWIVDLLEQEGARVPSV